MSTVLEQAPEIARLSRTVRLQWGVIALSLALALFAALRHEKPGPVELPAEIDTLHVRESLLVGEPPNTIELQTGAGIGAWVLVRQGKNRGLFMHVPEEQDGRPAFAIRDLEYRRRFE